MSSIPHTFPKFLGYFAKKYKPCLFGFVMVAIVWASNLSLILTHMDIYFQLAPLNVKRKMLGSIFPGKLIFQDGKYPTEGMNPALELILQKTNWLQKEKTGNTSVSKNVSGDMPSTGAFSNQFLEGMKLLYELEPFIKVKPYLTNQWEKNNSKIKNAS